ncbi:MAG: hypothetical protein M0P97_02795 [Candidatus Moranbacteria bacterium]|jgi:hypothetical protein|nr:hypothetical protein [Candidatus Moranbacteria bacterium]
MRKKSITLLILAIVVFRVFFWFMYSLIFFNGVFSPLYAIELSNPYVYYQKYIGASLLRYGQEYEINDSDISNGKIYKDNSLSFEFNYPENLDLTVLNDGHYIKFKDVGNLKEECRLEIESNGWEVGRKWLPRKRRRVMSDIKNGKIDELWYIRKNDAVFKITSSRFKNNQQEEISDDIQFMSVVFISEKNPFTFIKIADYENKCSEGVIRKIFATFRFVR